MRLRSPSSRSAAACKVRLVLIISNRYEQQQQQPPLLAVCKQRFHVHILRQLATRPACDLVLLFLLPASALVLLVSEPDLLLS